MFWRLTWQSWRYGLTRKLLAVLTLFLAASLVSALLAVSIDIGDKMAKELKSYGANILIEPASQAILPDEINQNTPLALQDLLDEKELPNIKDIFWRNNIVGFAPLLKAQAEIEIKNARQPLHILGTFFDHEIAIPDEEDFHTGQKIISPYWHVEGNWVNDKTANFAEQIPGMLGAALSQKLSIQLGDVVNLWAKNQQQIENPLRVKIVGIVQTGGEEDHQLILPLSVVQQWLGLVGKVQAIKVSALTVPENDLSRKARANVDGLAAEEYDRWYCTAYVSSISHQLEEAISGAVVRPIWQVAASEGRVIEKIQLLLAVVTIAALIASAMGVASLMSTTIIERSKEIGLMKALGAYQWQIKGLFYWEAILSGLLGGLLGCVAGFLLARFIGSALFGSPLDFAWIVVPVVVLLAIFIALIGAYFPIHRITKLYPIEVLYER